MVATIMMMMVVMMVVMVVMVVNPLTHGLGVNLFSEIDRTYKLQGGIRI